jgi:hypothetical protein
MSEVTKIYIDFKGSIPDMDGIRECDYYIHIEGKPVTDVMLESLRQYIVKEIQNLDAEDEPLDYLDLCVAAEEFMERGYGYKVYDDPTEHLSIEVNTDENS